MFKIILNDIFFATCQYGPMAIFTGCGIILILLLLRWIKVKKISLGTNDVLRYIHLYVLYIYGFMIISITILSREPGSRRSIDLKLFSTFSNDIWSNVFPAENVLLFIPLGFLLPLGWRMFLRLKNSLIAGLLLSLLIELIQLITQRGYLQTDDILLNVTGTLIGYLIFRMLALIHSEKA